MELIRAFQVSSAAAPLPDDFLNGLVEESARVPATVWRDAWAGLLVTDAPNELHRITAPTLVVSGDRDELFPTPHQEALAGAVPGARLLVYAETGHSPHWEHPDRFVADLTTFLLDGR